MPAPPTLCKPDHIIRLEQLADDLGEIGIDEPIVYANASEHVPVESLYTRSARQPVKLWAQPSFVRFG